MTPLQKIYWQARNEVERIYFDIKNPEGGLGLLSSREKPEMGVFGLFEKKPKYTSYTRSVPKWVYDQQYFNICTQVMGAIGFSLQEGMRFSVKYVTKRMKKDGKISGNGFSYIRAPLETITKYGILPYSSLPDDINGQQWPEFSKWDITPEQEAEATQYKSPSFRRIRNESEAIEAIENGYVLLTANKWYKGMNSPRSPHYYLLSSGGVIGGHAWPSPGFRAPNMEILDWTSHQSFGRKYGLNGMARIKSLFSGGMYEVYILEKLPGRSDIDRAVGLFEGYAIKGQNENTIYWVENGTKRAFVDEKAYNKYATYNYTLDQNLINNIPEGNPIYA